MRLSRSPDPILIQRLNDLVALDQRAVELCDLARCKGYLGDDVSALAELGDSHKRHIMSLLLLVESLGGRATVFRRLRGDAAVEEAALLLALYRIACRAHRVYHELLASPTLPVRVRGVLAGNLANERYYAAWLEQHLRPSPVSEAEPEVSVRAAVPR